MKFEKSRLYDYQNAEKLPIGSHIVASDNLEVLKDIIENNDVKTLGINFQLDSILSKKVENRFLIRESGFSFPFRYAYLLEGIQ